MFDICNARRPRAFTDEAKAVRCGHWLKALIGIQRSINWCIEHGVSLERAQSEGINLAGGFLTPVDFTDAVFAARDAAGAFRVGCDLQPMKSATSIRPRRVGGATAAFVGENQPIPESNLNFDAVEAGARKIGILLRSSSELWEDEEASLSDFLAAELGHAMALTEDDCGFNGTGALDTYGGITGLATKLAGTASAVPAGAGNNTYATLDFEDLASLIAGVQDASIPTSAWYVSGVGFAMTLCRLASAGALVAEQRLDGSMSASFMGFPVRFSSKLSNLTTALTGKPMIFFGDLARCATICERRALTIATSFERAIDQDEILIRATERIDIICHNTGDATTKAPMAMLVGTA
jgi:HK97 family phage major capsid protein